MSQTKKTSKTSKTVIKSDLDEKSLSHIRSNDSKNATEFDASYMNHKNEMMALILKQRTLENKDLILFVFPYLSVPEIYQCFEVSKGFSLFSRLPGVKKLVKSICNNGYITYLCVANCLTRSWGTPNRNFHCTSCWNSLATDKDKLERSLYIKSKGSVKEFYGFQTDVLELTYAKHMYLTTVIACTDKEVDSIIAHDMSTISKLCTANPKITEANIAVVLLEKSKKYKPFTTLQLHQYLTKIRSFLKIKNVLTFKDSYTGDFCLFNGWIKTFSHCVVDPWVNSYIFSLDENGKRIVRGSFIGWKELYCDINVTDIFNQYSGAMQRMSVEDIVKMAPNFREEMRKITIYL